MGRRRRLKREEPPDAIGLAREHRQIAGIVGRARRSSDRHARIVRSPGVCGGRARVDGTRLAVWTLEVYRRLGWTDSEFLTVFPQLSDRQLAAAWDYVAAHVEEIERDIDENQDI